MDLFIFGTLRDDALREIVLGRAEAGEPAQVPGHEVRRAAGGDHPVLAPGGLAEGLLVRGLTVAEAARLDFYEAGFGYVRGSMAVQGAEGVVRAQVYRPEAAAEASGEDWDLAAWQRDWGGFTRDAARAAMALYGRVDGPRLRRRMGTLRMRVDAARRAAGQATPVEVRRGFRRDDVAVEEARWPYVEYFALDETDLCHPLFGGGDSGRLTRAALVSGDAVTVLPYDPVRDRVLVVEQFRMGPFARGDASPWALEPIAGRVDPGEDPETTARRETREEAGLELGELWPVASYYPSPGAQSEYIYSYIGLCDLPDGAGGAGGAGGNEDEGEDIASHVLSFDRLMEIVASGEAETAPLILSALWLQRRRGAA